MDNLVSRSVLEKVRPWLGPGRAYCDRGSCVAAEAVGDRVRLVPYGPEAREVLDQLLQSIELLEERRRKWLEAVEAFKRGEATLNQVKAARSQYIWHARILKRHIEESTRELAEALGREAPADHDDTPCRRLCQAITEIAGDMARAWCQEG